MDYDWPGNVRELENVIERGVVLTTGTQIGRELIPDHVRTAPSFHVPHLTVPPEGICCATSSRTSSAGSSSPRWSRRRACRRKRRASSA